MITFAKTVLALVWVFFVLNAGVAFADGAPVNAAVAVGLFAAGVVLARTLAGLEVSRGARGRVEPASWEER